MSLCKDKKITKYRDRLKQAKEGREIAERNEIATYFNDHHQLGEYALNILGLISEYASPDLELEECNIQ